MTKTLPCEKYGQPIHGVLYGSRARHFECPEPNGLAMEEEMTRPRVDGPFIQTGHQDAISKAALPDDSFAAPGEMNKFTRTLNLMHAFATAPLVKKIDRQYLYIEHVCSECPDCEYWRNKKTTAPGSAAAPDEYDKEDA